MTNDKPTIWLWIRVPLRAIETAIAALKERAMLRHKQDLRAEADDDDEQAEQLRSSVRGQGEPPDNWKWPR